MDFKQEKADQNYSYQCEYFFNIEISLGVKYPERSFIFLTLSAMDYGTSIPPTAFCKAGYLLVPMLY